MTERSAKRADFLASVLTTGVEGGINYWAHVRQYKWYLPDLDGGSAEPGPNNTANAWVVIKDTEGEMDEPKRIGLDEIAHAISLICKKDHEIKYLGPNRRKAIVAASWANDAGDLDADDADAIIQVALFKDQVVFG